MRRCALWPTFSVVRVSSLLDLQKTSSVVLKRLHKRYLQRFFSLPFYDSAMQQSHCASSDLQLICSADPGRPPQNIIHLLRMSGLQTSALQECCFEMKNLLVIYKTVARPAWLCKRCAATKSDVVNDSFHFISKALSVLLILHPADIFLLFLVAAARFETTQRG